MVSLTLKALPSSWLEKSLTLIQRVALCMEAP